jgi:hypothetical protein
VLVSSLVKTWVPAQFYPVETSASAICRGCRGENDEIFEPEFQLITNKYDSL